MADPSADVVVVGAGLAGLSCALDLADKGWRVVLLEAGRVVGGRTSNWVERRMPVESGLHRFLGVYNALPAVLQKAGVDIDDILCWEDAIEIRTPDGPSGVFGASPLHSPVDTVTGLLGNNALLHPLDKASLLRFFAAGFRDLVLAPRRLDSMTITEYAAAHGLTKRALEHLVVPLTTGVFFLPPQRFSAFALFGFLAPAIPRLYQFRLGGFLGGMTDVMAEPIRRAIEQRGGIVRTGIRVTSLLVEDGHVRGVHIGRRSLRARHVVLATSLAPAQKLLRGSFKRRRRELSGVLSLKSMPAVTLQLELSERSMEFDRTTFGPGTSWGSFSEQSRTTFQGTAGRLSIILVPPGRFLGMKARAILDHALADGERLGIPLRGKVRRYRVVRHPADFYSMEPGQEDLRPPQETAIPGLTLAGDYTRQPWLASMEGAALSGASAAEVTDYALSGRTSDARGLLS